MDLRHAANRLAVTILSVGLVIGSLVVAVHGALAQSPGARAPSGSIGARVTSTQFHPGWALDRVDQRRPVLDHQYRSRTRGRGVRVYVIDCGAEVANSQFGGRAVRGANTVGGHWTDCLDEMAVGHATFVSGIIGGVTTGVAKRVRIISVRALSEGEGVPTPPLARQLRRVVRAIDWVISDASSHGRPAVVNLSLAFHGTHQRLTEAMARLEAAGITAVVAAGNDGGDACRRTPASVPTALVVGAVNRHDRVWSGSNVGPCVDLFAPGVGVRSVLDGGGAFTYRGSGATSWATPYVSGVAALFLSRHPHAPPARVRRWILMAATSGRLSRLPPATANRLLYSFAPLG